jgi:hypothetical protein
VERYQKDMDDIGKEQSIECQRTKESSVGVASLLIQRSKEPGKGKGTVREVRGEPEDCSFKIPRELRDFLQSK